MADTIHIPGYKVIRTLGRGGMAAVYLAIQESFEREVALKVMNANLANDEKFTERFLREAKIVSRLIHPNIVTVYDVGVHENLHFLSMEYIPGQDLKSQRRQLTLGQCLQVVKDIAKALDYAGKKGFVHRDVKPENIMLHEEDGRAVLMDFGIACMADTASGMTQTGTAIGTPHYMSPEQAKGRPVDTRADLYSLGVVTFLLLVGYVPYDADSAVAIGIKHVSEPIPRLPKHLQLLQPIIDKVLAKDPNQRYQTGAEFIEALEAITPEDEAAMAALGARLESLRLDAQRLGAADPTPVGSLPRQFSSASDRTTVAVSAVPTPESGGAIDQHGQLYPQRRRHTDPGRSGENRPTRTPVAENQRVAPAEIMKAQRPRREERLVIDEEDRLAHDVGQAAESRRRWPWAIAAVLAGLVAAGVYFRDYLPAPLQQPVALGIEHSLALAAHVRGFLGLATPETEPAVTQQLPSAMPSLPAVDSPRTAPDETVAGELVLGAAAITSPPTEEIKAGHFPAEDSTLNQARSLRDELERDLSVAPQLAQLYRDVLAAAPTDRRAEFGLTELRDYHYRHLRDALQARDLERSQRLLNSLGASFPEGLSADERYQRIQADFARVERAQVEIDRGNEFLVQNALTAPADANALEAFRAALTIDPGNPKAEAGIERIVERYLALAQEHRHKGEHEAALQMAERGLAISPANESLQQLQQAVAGELDHRAKLQNLRAAAEKLVAEKHLITPRGESALDRYRELLAADPGNDAAARGVADIERRLSLEIEDMVNASQFGDARNRLLAAREAFPASERLLALGVSLDRAIEADFLARQPKIAQILVSGTMPDSIQAKQQAALAADRTLYVGFSYANFAPETSVVQAVLFDGTRSVEIVQVPVIVSGKEGVKFFPIERPVEGFPSGGYNIELYLNGDRLSSLAFRVESGAFN